MVSKTQLVLFIWNIYKYPNLIISNFIITIKIQIIFYQILLDIFITIKLEQFMKIIINKNNFF